MIKLGTFTIVRKDVSKSKSFLASVRTPGIDSVTLSFPWADLEPTPGAWAFDAVVKPILDVVPAGISFQIGLVPGIHTPEWLTDPKGRFQCDFLALSYTPPGTSNILAVNYANPLAGVYQVRYTTLWQAFKTWLVKTGYYSRVMAVHLTPSCLMDGEVTCWSHDGSSNIDPKTSRYDSLWSEKGWRPSLYLAWTKTLASLLAGQFPSAHLVLPFLDPGTSFPRVTETGGVSATMSTLPFAQSMITTAKAVSVNGVAAMDTTMDDSPPNTNWTSFVALGALPWGQLDVSVTTKGRTMSGSLATAVAAGVQRLELHEAQAADPANAALILAYTSLPSVQLPAVPMAVSTKASMVSKAIGWVKNKVGVGR